MPNLDWNTEEGQRAIVWATMGMGEPSGVLESTAVRSLANGRLYFLGTMERIHDEVELGRFLCGKSILEQSAFYRMATEWAERERIVLETHSRLAVLTGAQPKEKDWMPINPDVAAVHAGGLTPTGSDLPAAAAEAIDLSASTPHNPLDASALEEPPVCSGEFGSDAGGLTPTGADPHHGEASAEPLTSEELDSLRRAIEADYRGEVPPEMLATSELDELELDATQHELPALSATSGGLTPSQGSDPQLDEEATPLPASEWEVDSQPGAPVPVRTGPGTPPSPEIEWHKVDLEVLSFERSTDPGRPAPKPPPENPHTRKTDPSATLPKQPEKAAEGSKVSGTVSDTKVEKPEGSKAEEPPVVQRPPAPPVDPDAWWNYDTDRRMAYIWRELGMSWRPTMKNAQNARELVKKHWEPLNTLDDSTLVLALCGSLKCTKAEFDAVVKKLKKKVATAVVEAAVTGPGMHVSMPTPSAGPIKWACTRCGNEMWVEKGHGNVTCPTCGAVFDKDMNRVVTSNPSLVTQNNRRFRREEGRAPVNPPKAATPAPARGQTPAGRDPVRPPAREAGITPTPPEKPLLKERLDFVCPHCHDWLYMEAGRPAPPMGAQINCIECGRDFTLTQECIDAGKEMVRKKAQDKPKEKIPVRTEEPKDKKSHWIGRLVDVARVVGVIGVILLLLLVGDWTAEWWRNRQTAEQEAQTVPEQKPAEEPKGFAVKIVKGKATFDLRVEIMIRKLPSDNYGSFAMGFNDGTVREVRETKPGIFEQYYVYNQDAQNCSEIVFPDTRKFRWKRNNDKNTWERCSK